MNFIKDNLNLIILLLILSVSLYLNIKYYGGDIEFFTSTTSNLSLSLYPFKPIKGQIISYAGDLKNLENSGWYVCDGKNNTPDLRNKFIFGADNSNYNADGGNKEITLTVENIPSHAHSFLFGNKENFNSNELRIHLYTGNWPDIRNPPDDKMARNTYPTGGKCEGGDNGRVDEICKETKPINILPPYKIMYWIIYLG